MTPQDVADQMRELSSLLDKGLDALRQSAIDYAVTEREYRRGKAQAWVDERTADLRYARDLAEGMRQAALEAVRSRRAQVSSLQTLLNAHRAEAEFARTDPR